MTLVKVTGLGEVTIHVCTSEINLKEKIAAFNKSAILSPQAVIFLKEQIDVSLSGKLYLPSKETIDLYAGGVLQTVGECIRTSMAFVDTEYRPSDFALA